MVLVVVGAYVGYYGWYELGLRSATGDPNDPVINGAARIQGAVAGWVYGHGPWPWVIALAVLVALYSVTVHGPRWAHRTAMAGAVVGSGVLGVSLMVAAGTLDMGERPETLAAIDKALGDLPETDAGKTQSPEKRPT